MCKKVVIFPLLFLCLIPSHATAEFYLPDTGQTKCYDSSGNEVACTDPLGLGQDGAYSVNAMSFTDNNGDGTVTDNNTGLMWQKCTVGQDPYTCSGSAQAKTWDDAQTACGDLNQTLFAGHSDWRLPSKKELITIIDYGIPYPGPTIDPAFPNTVSGDNDGYWTSLSYSGNPSVSTAWYETFDYGSVYSADKGSPYYVRCVRGEETAQSFKDNGNGTVTDSRTGLTWQKNAEKTAGLSIPWADALSYCEGLSLGGKADWRLPNAKELESLTDDDHINPAINAKYFPNTDTGRYWWSSTSLEKGPNYGPNYAYYVAFYSGSVIGYLDTKNTSLDVRCVRGGNSPSILTVTNSGAGTGTVTSSPAGINCGTGGTACTGYYTMGTKVTLTPVPDSGSVFTGWTGACTGTGACTVIMDGTTNVNANFDFGSCTYTIAPTRKNFNYKKGTVSIVVKATATDPNTFCPPPTIVDNNPGRITGTATPLTNNKGTIKLTIPELDNVLNWSDTLTIGGNNTFTVTQTGKPCSLSTIVPGKNTISSSAVSGATFAVNAPTGCTWSAAVASTKTPWLTISLGNSGNGSGTVTYNALQNTANSNRVGNIKVTVLPNKKMTFALTQEKFTANIAGTWSGTWNSSRNSSTGSLSATLSQNKTAISGTLSVYGTSCGDLINRPVTGTVNGSTASFRTSFTCQGRSVVLSMTNGAISLPDQDQITNGAYKVTQNGTLHDRGGFSLQKN